MMRSILLMLFCCFNCYLYSTSVHPSELGTDPLADDISQYPVAHTEFTKSPRATAQIKGETVPFCFFFDPREWQIVSRKKIPSAKESYSSNNKNVNSAEQILFESINKKLYASIIAENSSIPEKEIKGIVWENAKTDFASVTFTYEDKRKVNHLDILSYQLEGYLSHDLVDPFVFQEYIYRTPNSIVQISAYGVEKEYKNHETVILDFLNGISPCPGK